MCILREPVVVLTPPLLPSRHSLSYLVVLLAPSALVSDSMVMAWAGQMASQSLQAMQRSSPVA